MTPSVPAATVNVVPAALSSFNTNSMSTSTTDPVGAINVHTVLADAPPHMLAPLNAGGTLRTCAGVATETVVSESSFWDAKEVPSHVTEQV